MLIYLLTLSKRLSSERGAVAAEYAVLMTLVAIALVLIIQGLTGGITNTFQAIIHVLP